MIRQIEALNYRCLAYVKQPLGSFQVLVGPNASGKTTFLDVIAFMGRLMSDGLEAALGERSQNLRDILWKQEGEHFELAIEAAIPKSPEEQALVQGYDTIRYELSVGMHPTSGENAILEERVLLKNFSTLATQPRELFPVEPHIPDKLLTGRAKTGQRTIVSKSTEGNTHYYSEVEPEAGKGWYPSIRLSPAKSALANLHEDESRFPASTWLKSLLEANVQNIMLNSLTIKRASPPGQGRQFRPDGSNLPWVVHHFRDRFPERFGRWIEHLQTVLADLEDVTTVEREDDKHRYLKLHYRGGLAVPSWMASDGTLRLLALTLPAFVPGFTGIQLIEEPENGIHPTAVQAVFDALSSIYDAQVLLATHSPIILGCVDPNQVLCFSKTANGATDIVSGNNHPRLVDWHHAPAFEVLFASGVLS